MTQINAASRLRAYNAKVSTGSSYAAFEKAMNAALRDHAVKGITAVTEKDWYGYKIVVSDEKQMPQIFDNVKAVAEKYNYEVLSPKAGNAILVKIGQPSGEDYAPSLFRNRYL